jgi:hypothetical protein
MRVAIALPFILIAACNVSKEGNQTSVTFDQNAAESAVATAGDAAQNAGSAIVNDVGQAAGTVQNEVGDVDVDIDTDGNAAN